MSKSITVRKVGISTIGRLFGTVNAVVAVAAGLVGSIVTISAYVSTNTSGLVIDILGSIAIVATGLIVLPLIAFAFGWLYGALIALIFNLVIGVSGGVELEFDENGTVK